jgi:uncharacterized protein VirK/YbjX
MKRIKAFIGHTGLFLQSYAQSLARSKFMYALLLLRLRAIPMMLKRFCDYHWLPNGRCLPISNHYFLNQSSVLAALCHPLIMACE